MISAATSKKDETAEGGVVAPAPTKVYGPAVPIIRDPEVRKKLMENNATFDGTQLNFALPDSVQRPQSKQDEKGIIRTVADLVASAFTPLRSAFGANQEVGHRLQSPALILNATWGLDVTFKVKFWRVQ